MTEPDPPILSYAGQQFDPHAPEVVSNGRWYLILRRPGATLPPRCLICNKHVDGPMLTVKLCHSKSNVGRGYVAPFFMHLVGLIVIFFDQLTRLIKPPVVEVSYALCPQHQRRLRLQWILHCAVAMLALGLLPAALFLNLDGSCLRPAAVIMVIYVLLPWRPRPLLRVVTINESQVFLTGPKPVFLESLPKDDAEEE